MISFIGNLENIGDIIDKNLMELARKKLLSGPPVLGGRLGRDPGVPRPGGARISSGPSRPSPPTTGRWPRRCWTSGRSCGPRERDLRESHLGRLRAGLAESLETSEIHLDILTNLKRISSHVSALMFPILDEV